MSRSTSEVWLFFGNGSGDLRCWLGWFGETEANSTTSFLFGLSLEGQDLYPKNVIFGGRTGGNNGGGLCGYKDGNRLGNILGDGVKIGFDSSLLFVKSLIFYSTVLLERLDLI